MEPLQISKPKNAEWISFNIGGRRFTTTRTTLTAKEPASMLARMFAGSDGYSMEPSAVDETGAYLIDRSPVYFEPILNYLRHGKIIIDVDVRGVLEEAMFYGIESMIPSLLSMIRESGDGGAPLSRNDVIAAIATAPTAGDSVRFQGVNLAGADLSKLDLRNINFKHANLTKCNLSGANISQCCLERANLSHANLEGAYLLNVKAPFVNMEGANLKGCHMESLNGLQAILEGANLKGANLEGSSMCYVDLWNANMENCVLRTAVFHGANLQGCSFSGSDLQKEDLLRAGAYV